MLIGEFHHTLDEKKRLSLPSKFRKEMGKEVIISQGLDSCLFVFSKSGWQEFVEQLGNLSMGQSDSRGFTRFFLGKAVESTFDKAGRVLIPDFLKEFAGLSSKVIVVGVGKRVELWDESKWNTYTESISDKANELAQKLGELGMI